jgi:hypothetical protein
VLRDPETHQPSFRVFKFDRRSFLSAALSFEPIQPTMKISPGRAVHPWSSLLS